MNHSVYENTVFDDLVDDFDYAYRYYFDVIMRPFKEYVLKAIQKLQDKEIKIVAPSHGPILRSNPRKYIDYYQAWSTAEHEDTPPILAIFFLSAYGNTMKMAKQIGQGAQDSGLKVEIMDITGVEMSKMQDLVEKAAGVVVGSPTINGDVVKPAWDLLSSLATIKLKGKVGGAFGSFGWSGEAVPMLIERLKSLKLKVVEPGIKAHLVVADSDLQNCYEYGKRLAAKIQI